MLNPLLVKELRTWTRDRKIYAVIITLTICMSALAFGLIWDVSTTERMLDPEYGKDIFLAFAIVLMLCACLVFPAFAAVAISSERERWTFGMLRATLLKPRQILVGKAVPVIFSLLIFLFASLPVALLLLPSGGISVAEMAYCYLITLVCATAFSLNGLMWSSIFRGTRISAAMTYTVAGLLMFGTALIPMILDKIFQVKINRLVSNFCMSLNPFHAVASVLGMAGEFRLAGLSPWIAAIVGYLVISLVIASLILVRLRKAR